MRHLPVASFFDDRLEIWNNGTLPSSLSLDDLKIKHKFYPRNKNIAGLLYLRGYVETWGTGTNKMIALCKKNNIPEPVFAEYSGGFSVTFKFRDKIGVAAIKSNAAKQHSLSSRQKELFLIIKKHGAIRMIMLYPSLAILLQRGQ
jgi:ATP-dependent DNA helicase RecG